MKKIPLVLLSIMSLLCSFSVFAQQQQLLFGDKKYKVTIGAQYREPNGDLVSAAILESLPFYSPFMLVFKTDRAGNMLWVCKDTIHSVYENMRIGKLANNDYMILNCIGRQLIRLKPDNGAMVWTRKIQFSPSKSHQIRGFAELPDGNIVVCGYNDLDFSSSSDAQYKGFLVFFDSTGVLERCNYYGQNKGTVNDNYSFYDVVCLNNKLMVAGGFGRSSSIVNHGFMMSLDLSGKLLKTRLLDSSIIAGTDTLLSSSFNELSVVDGKLYVHGTSGSRQLLARVDTGTFSLSGHIINSEPYTVFFKSHFYVQDSATFYSHISAVKTVPQRKTFISKIHHGVISYCKKLDKDSLLMINSLLSGADDTVFVAGRLNTFSSGYSAYFKLSDTTDACGVSDTVLSINAFKRGMAAPAFTPITTSESVILHSYHRWGNHCLYTQYLCGEKVCPDAVKAQLDTTVNKMLCPGDTIVLASDGCYPKTWYLDGVKVSDTDDYLKINKAGAYMLVVSNNACSDTSSTIVINNKPVPVITRSGDTLISSAGLSYQWLDVSRKIIPGATSRTFIPSVDGTYYVEVTDSSGCAQISDSFVFDFPVSVRHTGNPDYRMLEVFPNPAGSHISIHNKSGHPAMVTIRDMNGRIILRQEQLAGIQDYQLEQLGLKPGVYWVQLLSGSHCDGEKLIVL